MCWQNLKVKQNLNTCHKLSIQALLNPNLVSQTTDADTPMPSLEDIVKYTSAGDPTKDNNYKNGSNGDEEYQEPLKMTQMRRYTKEINYSLINQPLNSQNEPIWDPCIRSSEEIFF